MTIYLLLSRSPFSVFDDDLLPNYLSGMLKTSCNLFDTHATVKQMENHSGCLECRL